MRRPPSSPLGMVRQGTIPPRTEGPFSRFGKRPFTAASTPPGRRVRTRIVLLLLTGLISVCAPMRAVQAQAASAVWPANSDPYAAFVAEASQRFGVPAAWIRAVMRAESGGDQHAISSAGAMGLMQIMPDTWTDLRARYGFGRDPFDPHDNILAGAAFLREMHDRFGSPGFLAAYNCGTTCYVDHIATGRPLPPETVAYVSEVLPLLGDPDAAMAALGPILGVIPWTQASLFVHHFDGITSAARVLSAIPSDGGQASVPVRDVSAIEPQSEGLFVALSASGKVP
jgi:hypothetical protein